MDIYMLIDKVLDQTASSDEIESVLKWIALSSDNQLEFEDLKLLHQISTGPNPDYDATRLSKIKTAMKEHNPTHTIRWVGILSLIIILFLACILFRNDAGQSSTPHYITFNQAPLITILETLSKYHKVSIVMQSEDLLQCRVTGTFSITTSLTECLKAIESITNLQYQIDTNKEIIIFGSCKSAPSKVLSDAVRILIP